MWHHLPACLHPQDGVSRVSLAPIMGLPGLLLYQTTMGTSCYPSPDIRAGSHWDQTQQRCFSMRNAECLVWPWTMCSLSSLFCMGFGFEYIKLSCFPFFCPRTPWIMPAALLSSFSELNVGTVTLLWAPAVPLNAFCHHLAGLCAGRKEGDRAVYVAPRLFPDCIKLAIVGQQSFNYLLHLGLCSTLEKKADVVNMLLPESRLGLACNTAFLFISIGFGHVVGFFHASTLLFCVSFHKMSEMARWNVFSVPKTCKLLSFDIFFFLCPLCSLCNILIFIVKVEVISKYARTLEEWFYRDYGSGLGATLPRSGPNFSTWSV